MANSDNSDETAPSGRGVVNLALTRGSERERLFSRHPVVTDRAKLPTPAIKGSFQVISSAIIHHFPGACFAADSRFGKSYAIAVLMQTLPHSFPDLPIYSLNAKRHDRPSERAFYTDILHDCRHGVAESGTASARRTRLLNMWISRAQASNSDRLLLFIDEAQNWDEFYYTFLRDLSNDLGSHDIRMLVVLFAHPSLLVVRTSLLSRERTDLIGRFMMQPMRFRGVASSSDLAEIARCYDDSTISEFPAGSGISYSRFFRPDAYRDGWRLENEVEQCLAAFSTAAGKQSGQLQIGMQWVANAVRSYFYSHWDAEHGKPFEDGDIWETAVRNSGYITTLGIIRG